MYWLLLVNLLNLPVAATTAAHTMANPRVSYHYDESVPFTTEQKEEIAQRVLEDMLVWEGPNVKVKFAPYDDFMKSAYDLGIGNQFINAYWDGQGNVVFNDRFFGERNLDRFVQYLEHELGHALGIPHQRSKSIMTESIGKWAKVTDKDRELFKESRGY